MSVRPQAVEAGGADKAADLWRASGLEVARFFLTEEDAAGLKETYPFLAA